MRKWIEKLKRAFTMTPKELHYAEQELKCIYGLEKRKLYPTLRDLYPQYSYRIDSDQ